MKVGWFGSPVAGIRYLPEDVSAIGEAIEGFIAAGAVLTREAAIDLSLGQGDPAGPFA